jgi:hypothetical protein
MSKMLLIQYFKRPFFKSYSFLLTPWINFSHLFVNFMHAHFHYISCRLLNTRISLSFHLNLVHDKGSLRGVLFALTHFCVLHPITTTHPTCVFPLLVDDTHIVGLASDVLFFFVIIGGVWHIKTFSAIDEVCCLVSVGVIPVYIIFSKFTFESNLHILGVLLGFFSLCGILHIRGFLGEPRHDH